MGPVTELLSLLGEPKLSSGARDRLRLRLQSQGIHADPPIEGIRRKDPVALTWEPVPPGARVRTRWRRASSTVRFLAGLVAFVSGFAGLVVLAAPALRAPTKMNGDLNVVVAEFGADNQTGQATDEGALLATSFEDRVAAALRSLNRGRFRGPADFDIETLGPDAVGVIKGSKTERSRKVAEIARARNADIVIYGTLTITRTRSSLQPEFYVSEDLSLDAPEIAGEFSLFPPLTVSSNVGRSRVAGARLRKLLLARARLVASIALALGWYQEREYEPASSLFSWARQRAGVSARAKATLDVLLGNTAQRLGRFLEAKRWYQRALVIAPEYSRAWFGLAEFRLGRSVRRGCERGVADTAGVRRAVYLYERARRARYQPARSTIQARISLGLGRALVCLSRAGADGGDKAFLYLRRVIADYDAGDDRLQEEAAEAHGLLAFLFLPESGALRNRRAKLLAAELEYLRAVELVDSTTREAVFWARLADVRDKLGRPGAARDAFRRALLADRARALAATPPDLARRLQ